MRTQPQDPTPGRTCIMNTVVETSAQPDESRQLIDAKIADFAEVIRRLKSQRNELASVSRLPPEIMSVIFSYVATQNRYPVPSLVDRYIFTHVSRTWRFAALNSPTLWRVLPSSIPWTEAMLERSKAVGLVVRLDLSYLSPTSPRVLFWKNVFRHHAWRFRELDLTGISKSTLSVFFGNLQPSSLALRTLQLSYSKRDDNPTFPTGIIEAKDLQSLSIAGYNGAWYSLALPCLTDLRMQDISIRPRLDEFLETLRGSPCLQSLDLRNSLPSAVESVGSITGVGLPKLRTLRLSSGNTKEVSNILSCIIVPSTATIDLECRNKGPMHDDRDMLTELASSLSVFFSAMSNDPAVTYKFVHFYTEDAALQLSAWENDYRPPKLSLAIEPRIYQSCQMMLQTIFPSLPLLNITKLTLELDCADTLLRETLSSLSCLRHVTVVGDCTFDFITSLMYKPQHYNTEASAFYSVSFPALQSLCIMECSCGPEGICPIEYLEDCLMERYERKAGLTKVNLVQCYDVYSYDVDILKEIVVDVEWDGCEMEEPRSESDDLDYFDDDIDYDLDFYDFF